MCSLFLKDTNKERKDWNILIGNTNQCGERWKLDGRRIRLNNISLVCKFSSKIKNKGG